MKPIAAGSSNQRIDLFIQDSSSANGAGLTGLVFNSPSLTAFYHRPGSNAVQITLANQTVTGNYTSGGFVEVSSANMPGLYTLDPPNAAIAAGVDEVTFMLKGAANMAPMLQKVILTGQANGLPVNDANSLAPANAVRIGGTVQTGRDVGADSAANALQTSKVVCRGTVGNSTTPSTTQFTPSALTPAGVDASQFVGRVIVFDADTTTTALRGQATTISASSAASLPLLTYGPLTRAPASGDTFSIL